MNPTEEQMEDQRALALDGIATGRSKFPGSSYEDGVRATIEWVMGESDDKPMDD